MHIAQLAMLQAVTGADAFGRWAAALAGDSPSSGSDPRGARSVTWLVFRLTAQPRRVRRCWANTSR
jgi:hypothetical protein